MAILKDGSRVNGDFTIAGHAVIGANQMDVENEINELKNKPSALSVTMKRYEVTIDANSYVTPYTYYGNFTIPTEDIALYGEPICATATGYNGAAVPVSFSSNRYLSLVNTGNGNVVVYITYLNNSTGQFIN